MIVFWLSMTVFWTFMLVRNSLVWSYLNHLLNDGWNKEFPTHEEKMANQEEILRRVRSMPHYNVMLFQLFTFNWDYRWKESK